MKLYLTLLLWCMGLLCLAQTDFNTENEVFATTNFYGRHCRGDRGLCSVTIEKDIRMANTIISVKNDSILEFYIVRDKLNPSEIQKICGIPAESVSSSSELNFTINHSFIMPENLKLNLQINPFLTQIKSDVYTIITTNDYFIITLKLE